MSDKSWKALFIKKETHNQIVLLISKESVKLKRSVTIDQFLKSKLKIK